MNQAIRRSLLDLGPLGLGAILVLVSAAATAVFAVLPMERRASDLARLVDARKPAQVTLASTAAHVPGARVKGFYGFLDRTQRVEDWLAKLYGAASAAGLELRTGDYQTTEGGGRIERYRISLPVSGSYPQIRIFLQNALTEIPVASLDQINFRRKFASDTLLEAQVVLTLHVLRR